MLEPLVQFLTEPRFSIAGLTLGLFIYSAMWFVIGFVEEAVRDYRRHPENPP